MRPYPELILSNKNQGTESQSGERSDHHCPSHLQMIQQLLSAWKKALEAIPNHGLGANELNDACLEKRTRQYSLQAVRDHLLPSLPLLHGLLGKTKWLYAIDNSVPG